MGAYQARIMGHPVQQGIIYGPQKSKDVSRAVADTTLAKRIWPLFGNKCFKAKEKVANHESIFWVGGF